MPTRTKKYVFLIHRLHEDLSHSDVKEEKSFFYSSIA